jgi:hypothetical protein
MIKIDTDEVINEIEEFAMALMDKDQYAMKEVLYLVSQRMISYCDCLEEPCICRS